MKRIILAIALLWCTVVISPNIMAQSAAHPNIVKSTPRPEDQASLKKMASEHSCDDECFISMGNTTGTRYMCPSLDSGSCNLSPLFLSLMNTSQIPGGTPSNFRVEEPAMATNTTVVEKSSSMNDYYYAKAVYEPPTMVTIGGFSTPVTGNPLYYSPFKHRHGAPMPAHNHKGLDATADVGAGPHPSGIPESIGTWPQHASDSPSR